MKDQCQELKKYGILIIILIANVKAIDYIVWKKIEAENYIVIFASSKILL